MPIQIMLSAAISVSQRPGICNTEVSGSLRYQHINYHQSGIHYLIHYSLPEERLQEKNYFKVISIKRQTIKYHHKLNLFQIEIDFVIIFKCI